MNEARGALCCLTVLAEQVEAPGCVALGSVLRRWRQVDAEGRGVLRYAAGGNDRKPREGGGGGGGGGGGAMVARGRPYASYREPSWPRTTRAAQSSPPGCGGGGLQLRTGRAAAAGIGGAAARRRAPIPCLTGRAGNLAGSSMCAVCCGGRDPSARGGAVASQLQCPWLRRRGGGGAAPGPQLPAERKARAADAPAVQLPGPPPSSSARAAVQP